MPEFTMTELDDDYSDPAVPETLPDPDEQPSGLAALARAMQAAVNEPVRFPIPSKPGYALECRTDLTKAQALALQKQARKDDSLYERLVLASTTIGIYENGAPILDSEGEKVQFGSPEMLQVTGANSAAAAVGRFIGHDGSIVGLAAAVVKASGYGVDIDPDVDPTGSGA